MEENGEIVEKRGDGGGRGAGRGRGGRGEEEEEEEVEEEVEEEEELEEEEDVEEEEEEEVEEEVKEEEEEEVEKEDKVEERKRRRSNLDFYAHSTRTVISGREEKKMKLKIMIVMVMMKMTFNGGDDGDSQFISSTRESVMMRKERDCVDGFRTPRYCVCSSTTSDRPVGCGSSACTFTAPLNTQQHRPQFITCTTSSEHTATQTTVHHL